jgi:hypothetical protein
MEMRSQCCFQNGGPFCRITITMAPSYSHPKMFPFNLVLKDKYYIPKLTRTRSDVSVSGHMREENRDVLELLEVREYIHNGVR